MSVVLLALGAYCAAGFVFGLIFVTRIANRLDPAAAAANWAFRLAIFPGAVALWPVLLRRNRR